MSLHALCAEDKRLRPSSPQLLDIACHTNQPDLQGHVPAQRNLYEKLSCRPQASLGLGWNEAGDQRIASYSDVRGLTGQGLRSLRNSVLRSLCRPHC